MRRRQFDSLKLRHYSKSRFDIEVGLYSYGCFDRWRMPGPMQVGRYCSIASTVRSVDRNHPSDALTTHPALYEKSFGVVAQDLPPAPPLVIEDDVWIGHNAIILPGCKFIGRGAIIGASSIVTRNVNQYEVVAGIPAKKIRDRFAPELAAAINASRWWEMELSELRNVVRDIPDVVFAPNPENLCLLGAGRSRD
jgi:acetyltransferase-like isoleucine patch superfamily enzyme